MNNVHLVTQEKKTSQNGSKMGRVHRVHCPRPARAPSAQAARPAPRPRAQRPGRAPAAKPALPRARPHLLPRLVAPRAPCGPAASPRVRPRTQRPSVPSCPVLGHNTPRCIATQCPLAKPADCNTRDCITIQSSHSQPPACNTTLTSHNTLTAFQPAIQFLYCN